MTKKILPIILLLWPYLFFLCSQVKDENGAQILFGGYLILTIVVYLANIINAWTYRGKDAYYVLAKYNMLIKLLHIPFYLLVFFAGMAMFCAMVVPALVFVSPLVIFMLFLVDVFLMFTSSAYGCSALFQAARQKRISAIYGVWMGILQFIFVADVISAVCVFVKMRRKYLQETKGA